MGGFPPLLSPSGERRAIVRMNQLICCTALVGLFLQQSALEAKEKVDVKVVKYAELADTINQFKGHVVVVDFWANW
jgi:hypothetical protein